MKKTLSILLAFGVLALGAVPASAGGRGGHGGFHGHGGHGVGGFFAGLIGGAIIGSVIANSAPVVYAPPPAAYYPSEQVWVPGHYVTRYERQWVPGYWSVERPSLDYDDEDDYRGGRRVWVPGHYENVRVQVWIPGHWEDRG